MSYGRGGHRTIRVDVGLPLSARKQPRGRCIQTFRDMVIPSMRARERRLSPRNIAWNISLGIYAPAGSLRTRTSSGSFSPELRPLTPYPALCNRLTGNGAPSSTAIGVTP